MLKIAYPPGLTDIPDSLLATGQIVNGFVLTAIKENAAFGAVKWEIFYGEYAHGDTVQLPTSTVDGYEYRRNELIYAWEDRSTVNATDGLPAANGGLLWQITRVDQGTGEVTVQRAYYVDGGAQTNTNDGRLAVWTFGIRGRALISLASTPSYTEISPNDFTQDASLSEALITDLCHNSKLAAVRSEVFIMNPSGAPTWQANHAYSLGDLVQPTTRNANGAWFVCALAGTSGAKEPSPWPSVPSAAAIQDGSVLWNVAGWGFQNGQQVPLPVSAVDGYAYSAAECVAVIPFWETTQSLPHSSGVNILWTSGKGNILRLQKSITRTQPNSPAGPGAPAAPTLSQTAGGTLATTTYYVQITYVNALGESVGSTEVSLAASANNLLTVASPYSAQAATQGATGWNVYVSTSSGTETKQNSSPIALGANWTEPTSGLVSGVGVPGVSVPSYGGVHPQADDIHGLGSWAALTVYAAGDQILDSNFNTQLCVVGGTSGTVEPSWIPVMGATTVDGSVTWLCTSSPGGWQNIINYPTTPANQQYFAAQLSPGTATTGCGIVNLAVTYENGSFPDGTVGVIVIAQRSQSAMGMPGGAMFTDFDDGVLTSGNPLDYGYLQDINENAKFGILRPEIFVSSQAAGDTVSLPTSPVDGYAYSRSELSYEWFITDLGQPGGKLRDFQVLVDPQTGLVSSHIDYFVASDNYASVGTAIRGSSTTTSNLPSTNDGIPKITVITVARRAHESELIAELQLNSPGYTMPAPPSKNNLIPNGGFEIWSTANTTAVAFAGVADEWGVTYSIGKTATLQETGLVGKFAQGLGAYAATQYQDQRVTTFGQAGQIGIGSMAVPIVPGGIYGLSFVAESSPNSMSGGFFCRVHLRDSTDSLDAFFELLGDQTPHEVTTNLGAALSSSSRTNFGFTFSCPQNGDTSVAVGSNAVPISSGTLSFIPQYVWLEFLNIAPVRGGSTGVEFVILDEVALVYQQAPVAVSAMNGQWDSSVTYSAGATVFYNGSFWQANNTNSGSAPTNVNPDWQQVNQASLDVLPDGNRYKRVTSVNTSNQATTDSIEPGAVNTTAQYTHTTSASVSASTWTQIATITPAVAGGVVIPICYFDIINQGGTSALNVQCKMYKGDNTGTVLWEDDYPTVPAGANMPVTALGYDSAPPSGSQQYSVYVYSTVDFAVIAVYLLVLNPKV